MRRSCKSQPWRKLLPFFTAAILGVLFAVAPMTALGQTKAPAKDPQSGTKRASPSTSKKPSTQKSDDMAWLRGALKDPEFMKAVDHLSQRLTTELQYPGPRTQSRILPRLSDAAGFYAAFPNYGQTLHQAQQILQDELRNSPTLQDFIRKNKLEKDEPKFEEALQKLYAVSEYLGDEVVLTGSFKGNEPSGVMIGEVRKPGLKEFLETMSHEWEPMAKEQLRVLGPQQLASATDLPGQGPIVLVRQDVVVVGFNTATLRKYQEQLDDGRGTLAASVMGKRLMQAYQTGTGTILAADLQNLLTLVPQNPPQARMMLEKSGFSDMKYAVMDSKLAGKNATTQLELVFNGPRRSIASWIAAPAPLGSLGFMSPNSYVTEAFRLKPLTQIFDDIIELAGPNATAMLPQMEANFNVNLKQDLLSKLSGEIGFEMQAPPIPPAGGNSGHMVMEPPKFKIILGVSDAVGLQQTLKRLLAQSPVQPQERVEDGVTFYSLSTPSANGPGMEINYFFLDGYLIVATTREQAQEALRAHRSGTSLAHSSQLAAQGQPPKASMMVYQNSGPFLAAIAQRLSPDTAAMFSKALSSSEPATTFMYGYADETSIRGTANNNIASGASFGLIAAAVAIPNLLRSRIAANESAAAATVRTVNTAQVAYSTVYPDRGYAPSLAAMGPPPGSDCSDNNDATAAHACMLDNVVGNAGCTSGKWCTKGGYRFSVRGVCVRANCKDYVVTATPLSKDTGTKSFCSVDDAVVRINMGAPLETPLTVAQCLAWKPLM
jgi:type II secretory pathway pseudopilin PulG